MKEVEGDLLKLAKEGKFDILVHGCNCMSTMGAGIAKQVAREYPQALAVDRAETEKGDRTKIGTYTKVAVGGENGEHTFTIVNAYTQYRFKKRYKGELLADYAGIREVFGRIKKDFSGLRIGYPLIGAGLANGDWKVISAIIEEQLEGEDHTLVVYKP